MLSGHDHCWWHGHRRRCLHAAHLNELIMAKLNTFLCVYFVFLFIYFMYEMCFIRYSLFI